MNKTKMGAPIYLILQHLTFSIQSIFKWFAGSSIHWKHEENNFVISDLFEITKFNLILITKQQLLDEKYFWILEWHNNVKRFCRSFSVYRVRYKYIERICRIFLLS